MKIVKATESDVLDLYRLQLLTFESEAEMIGSRMVPALMESEEEFKATFTQWHTYKLVDDGGRIIGGIRYQYDDGVVEVGLDCIVHLRKLITSEPTLVADSLDAPSSDRPLPRHRHIDSEYLR